MKSNWERHPDEGFVKVFVHKTTGDIRCVYPKAPKWAQKVAFQIWKDTQSAGEPTAKGVKNIVKGQWAKMISEAAKEQLINT